MEKTLHKLIWKIVHFSYGFIHSSCTISAINSIIDYAHVTFPKQMVPGKELPFMNSYFWFLDVHICIPGHSTKATIMVHIIVSSGCCADSHASELQYFSLPVLREPKWRLRTPILHWTFKLHLLETLGWYRVGTLHPVFDMTLHGKKQLETRLCRPLSCPTQPFFLTPGTCSMTLGVQILDVGIDAHGLATKPFDSQHASISTTESTSDLYHPSIQETVESTPTPCCVHVLFLMG